MTSCSNRTVRVWGGEMVADAGVTREVTVFARTDCHTRLFACYCNNLIHVCYQTLECCRTDRSSNSPITNCQLLSYFYLHLVVAVLLWLSRSTPLSSHRTSSHVTTYITKFKQNICYKPHPECWFSFNRIVVFCYHYPCNKTIRSYL